MKSLWHHFWSMIGKHIDNKVEAHKVTTQDQRADYLTKGLPREVFERNRKDNQGW